MCNDGKKNLWEFFYRYVHYLSVAIYVTND